MSEQTARWIILGLITWISIMNTIVMVLQERRFKRDRAAVARAKGEDKERIAR